MLINYNKELLIDHRSTVPVEDQLYNQYEDLLSSAKVINKQSLISPDELAEIIHVSPSIVRKVYQKLEKNNFIMIDHERIAYVSKFNRILDFFNRLVMIEDGIKALGKEASEALLEFEVVEPKEKDFAEVVRFEDKRFLRQVRMFKADNEPYIYLEEFYPIERFPILLDAKEKDGGRVYENILINEYDIYFKRNKRVTKVECLDKRMSKLMHVRKGLTSFKIDMVYYDQHDLPIAYAKAVSLPYFYFDYNIKIK